MAKLTNFKASVDLISGLRPKNGNDFPLVQAHDIQVDEDGTRLDEALENVGGGEVIEVGSLEALPDDAKDGTLAVIPKGVNIPDGGLPEVVLTTPVDMGTTFTVEENVALTAALATGKPAIVKCTVMDTPGVAMMMNNFAGQGLIATYANINILLMTDGENWSAFVEELRVLPEVTEDDNSKFLQVVGGAFALVALTDVSKEGA